MLAQNRALRHFALGTLFALCLAFSPVTTEPTDRAASTEARFAPLLEKYHDTLLRQLRPLLTDEEAEAFKRLQGHSQRIAFIETFWRYLDPTPEDTRNPLRERWQEQVRDAQRKFKDPGDLAEARGLVRRIAGAPTLWGSYLCGQLMPVEIWYYDLGGESMYVLFVTTDYDQADRFELWWPARGTQMLTPPHSDWNKLPPEALVERLGAVQKNCGLREGTTNYLFEQALLNAVDWRQLYEQVDIPFPQDAGEKRAAWLAQTLSQLEQLPPAESLDSGAAELNWRFGGFYLDRTLVEGRARVPLASLEITDPHELALTQVDLEGEVWQGGTYIDSFRFSFHSASLGEDGESAQIFFVRALEPGSYQLLLHGARDGATLFRRFVDLQVPATTEEAVSPTGRDADLPTLVDNANVSIFGQYSGIRILPPGRNLMVGEVDILTLPIGVAVRTVDLYLDDELVAHLDEPPFNARIDVGREPRRHKLEAVALDAAGQRVARDEVELNTGWHHFAIRLVEPDGAPSHGQRLQARAEVDVPSTAKLDRVEFFLDDTLVTTLYEAPFVQTLEAGPNTSFVRAVATLQDGRSVEDLRLLHVRGELDEIDVQLVEMYVSVMDGSKAVADLGRENFQVLERGEPVQLQRFEYIDNLPVNVLVLMDTSSSMRSKLGVATESSLGFIDSVLTEGDQAAFLEFNHRAQLTAPFTKNLDYLRLATTTIGATGGTRLYDSVIQAMYYFAGVEGKQALVVISDGRDQHSHFTEHQMVEYGLRAGVAVYVISLQERLGNPQSPSDLAHKRVLQELADATGGRYFHVPPGTDLDRVYELISHELRSQYLLTFHAPEGPSGFRQVDVEIEGAGRVKVRTRRGYMAH